MPRGVTKMPLLSERELTLIADMHNFLHDLYMQDKLSMDEDQDSEFDLLMVRAEQACKRRGLEALIIDIGEDSESDPQ
jgi:hypothetical protein